MDNNHIPSKIFIFSENDNIIIICACESMPQHDSQVKFYFWVILSLGMNVALFKNLYCSFYGDYRGLLMLPQAYNFIKKETQTQVFSFEFCESFKKSFFTEHFWATA